MSRQNDARPIVIKRKKVIAGGGHHGGAWKVAYADFVTAMMAFFLMMWLLGATTESQRRGLADYFNPTIPVHRISSGGAGLFGGTDLETRSQQGPSTPSPDAQDDPNTERTETQSFEDIQTRLRGLGGESMVLREALRHVVTRQTDEGLVFEAFDLPNAPLFQPETAIPTPVLEVIVATIAEASSLVINALSVEAHTRSYSVVQLEDPTWSLSMARADHVRTMLEGQGLDPARVARVVGHADRRLVDTNPMAVRNNRLVLIFLRNNRR